MNTSTSFTKKKYLVVMIYALLSTMAICGILSYLSDGNMVYNFSLWSWGIFFCIFYLFNKYLLLEGKYFCFSKDFLMCLFFSLLQVCGILWSNSQIEESPHSIKKIVWVAGLSLIVYCVKNILYSQIIIKNIEQERVKNQIEEKHYGVGKVFLIIMLGFSIPFMTYFPAIVAYDSINQLTQITTNTYTTHHPLIHTLMLGLCMKVGEIFPVIKNSDTTGLMCYSVIQMIIMASGFTFAYKFLRRWGVNCYLCYVFVAFVAFFPTHGMLAISITKDTIYGILVMVFTLYLCEIILGKGKCISNSKWCLEYGVVTVLLLLFRNNSIYAWLLFFICSLFAFRKKEYKKKVLCIHIFVLLGFSIINLGLTWGSNANSKTYAREMLSVPAQQIARVVMYHYDELSSMEKELIGDVWGEELPEYYPAIADRSKKAITNEPDMLGSFGEAWFRLGIKYPGTYLRSFMLKNKGMWYLGDTSYLNEIYSYDTGYLQITCPDNQLEIVKSLVPGYERHQKLQLLQSIYRHFIAYNDWQKFPLLGLVMQPAFYCWILFGYLLFCMRLKQSEMIIPAIYLLGLTGTLLLGPCVLVRYVYPIMISIVILILLFFQKIAKRDESA